MGGWQAVGPRGDPGFVGPMAKKSAPDPASTPAPVGDNAAVATARAFSPSHVGWGKTVGAIGIIVANGAFFFAVDQGWVIPNGTFALLAAQVFGLLTGSALRHLGTRWSSD